MLSLQNVFSKWLHDCGMDNEHLHLALPPETMGEDAPLVIKCDLQERILDPALFGSNVAQTFVSMYVSVVQWNLYLKWSLYQQVTSL